MVRVAGKKVMYMHLARGRCSNKSIDEQFSFEGNETVIDTILNLHSISISDIAHVDIRCSLVTALYMVTVNVVRGDGEVKVSSYAGYVSPADMVEVLENMGYIARYSMGDWGG